MKLTSTHTYVTMDVSTHTFEEIAENLKAAGYEHCFADGGKTIDLHGLALTRAKNLPIKQVGWLRAMLQNLLLTTVLEDWADIDKPVRFNRIRVEGFYDGGSLELAHVYANHSSRVMGNTPDSTQRIRILAEEGDGEAHV